MYNNHSNRISLYYLIATVIFISGYVFYILVRGVDPLFNINFGSPLGTGLPTYIQSSYATFSHVLALSLFSYALVGLKQHYKFIIILFWSILNSIFEMWQSTIVANFFSLSQFPGTFDAIDLLAVLVATVLFIIITGFIDKNSISPKTEKRIVSKFHAIFTLPLVTLFGIMSIMATSTGENYPRDEPVYLSYEELRGPLKIETNRKLQKSGKIYLYQNLLLVSEPNKGIHIYDNSIPALPNHKVFINLPGNLDIAVRAGYLYADSFIDLVVIDINDLNNIIENQRIKGVFPYDAYQAIEKNFRTFYLWDKSKGVIINVYQPPSYEIN